jgi:hypothetical protein
MIERVLIAGSWSLPDIYVFNVDEKILEKKLVGHQYTDSDFL